MSEQNYSATA